MPPYSSPLAKMKPRRAQSETSSSMRKAGRSRAGSLAIRSAVLEGTSRAFVTPGRRQFPFAPGECQFLVEDAAALELDAHVEAEEAAHEPLRLGQRFSPEGEAAELVERKGERSIERPQRAEMDRQHGPVRARGTGCAERAALPDQERDRRRRARDAALGRRERAPASHAGEQLGPEPERVERPELEQHPHALARRLAVEPLERAAREGKQAREIARRAALRREPIEQLQQVAAEREARGARAERLEGAHQACAFEPRQRAGPAPHDLHRELVEQVERTREALAAAPRALGDRG